VVEALTRLSEKQEALGKVFNIGSNEEITILELAKRVRSMTASPSEIGFVPYDEAYEEGFEDMPRRVPDISRIQSLIGYEPSKNLEQIVQSVIDYQEALLKAPADTT
jgi:UDP-glucose 4-epimerase